MMPTEFPACPHARLSALRRALCTGARHARAQGDIAAALVAEDALAIVATGDLSAFAGDLGIVARGGVSRDARENLRRRDILLRALHREMKIADKGAAGAALIAARFSRYETTAWPRDRKASAVPADPVAAICYQICSLDLPDRSRMPGARRVAVILAEHSQTGLNVQAGARKCDKEKEAKHGH
jgi:hypothetical protein